MPNFECDCKNWQLPMGEWISKCPCGETYQFCCEWNERQSKILKSYVEVWRGNQWFRLPRSQWI